MSLASLHRDTVTGDLLVPTLPHAFPSPELVSAAAGLFQRLPAWDGSEGPRSRIIVAPGMVQVSRRDPARLERASERAIVRRRVDTNLLAFEQELPDLLAAAQAERDALVALLGADSLAAKAATAHYVGLWDVLALIDNRDSLSPARIITSWSRKSRSNMGRVLASLDYAPLLEQGDLRAMLTLTYPGDWLPVAPNARACKRHVDELKRRYRRAWGRPMIGVWKREFQRRGAPHYHILMCPPPGEILDGGERVGFRAWVSRTWAAIVAHPDEDERRRHALAGTGLDYAVGLRSSDPRRIAVYFAKHGTFGAKDYQNDAPAEWLEAGVSVGRFWGVWGLSKSLAVVEVSPDHALAAARTMRRYSRAQGATMRVQSWRAQGIDQETGEVRRWRKRWQTIRVKRVRGDLGYLVVNDGPAFASSLARYLDTL